MKLLLLIINFFIRHLGLRISNFEYDHGKNKLAKRIFRNRKLQSSSLGFWQLDPMPSVNQLNEYYENAYWSNRGGKKMQINERDLVHWCILNEYLSDIKKTKLNFLNFGAGHGGVSHLFWCFGHSVYNVEPSFIPKVYDERWVNYKTIKEVKDNSIDIIYGSHSLEHVQNIQEFMFDVTRISKDNACMFWEVPNGLHPSNGAIENKIFIPHTYYFRKEYFENILSEIFLCSTFNSPKSFGQIQNWKEFESDEGNVIRVLGKF